MRNISAWAIRHPVTPIVLFTVLFLLGIVAFVQLPIDLDPDIDYPLVEVSVSQPGAAPTEIESQIIQKIEGAVSSIGDVHTISSYADEGQATTDIEFQIGTPIDRAVADVRDAVANIRSNLPEGIQEPLVRRVDVVGGPIAYYAVSTTQMSQQELSWFIDNA
ncbi:MAG TPA: efflux RND transporter permease subunit, partial [Steroidobacteraceae bacterium]|nr:efflux RND transporter permease subunit [Steroidobacteraceae bacterium]